MRGSRAAGNVISTNTTDASTSTQRDDAKLSSTPGPAASAPPSPLSNISFEFASTRSRSSRTSPGTTALLATWYVLPATNAPNASGNSSSESRWRTISSAKTARAMPAPMIIPRRPPRLRSTSGPISGPTTANGAIVTSRYSATLGRAAAGSRLKNSDPASAIAINASPAADSRCVRASQVNGCISRFPES